jgi:YidC/Oxa1 family membrane protein insertase
MISLFHTFFYDPIYNLLVFLVGIVPGGSIALAVIGATIVVKIILLPVSLSAVRTQLALKKIDPAIKELREKFKNNRQKQAEEMLALYKEHKVNPFASILSLFIQLPIIIALSLVFFREAFPAIDLTILYSFVQVPETFNLLFLGLIPMDERSIALALIAGVTQYLQISYAMPIPEKQEKPSFQEEFARGMALQMRYILPFIIAVVAFTVSAAIALYFITSNVVALLQEWYVRKTIKKPHEERGKNEAETRQTTASK